MQVDDDRPIPIWFVGSDATGPDMFYKIAPSATKDATQFTREDSPLKGLWHKHYYIHQGDFLKRNIENIAKRHRFLIDATPVLQMMARIVEGAVTGEWIIFRRENEINTYLCLAKHNDDDVQIYGRIKKALT